MRLLGTRLLQLIPVLFLVSLLTFSMTEFLPGDPVIAILGENAQPDQIVAVRHELGFDKPFVERYVDWLGNAVRGDLGKSLRSNQPVSEAVRDRLPVNAELAFLVVAASLLISIPLGAWSAYRAGKLFDRGVTATSFGLSSVPPFLSALLLVAIFAVKVEWFPVNGWFFISEGLGKNLRHLVLPVAALAVTEIAVYCQLLRADMVATLQEDYIMAARARGLPVRHLLLREALRPSSFSLITLAGVNIGRLIAGTVIVETIFGLPGIGRLTTQAIPQKDFPILQGGVLALAVIYLFLNLLVDLAYPLLDPRVRRRDRA
jgi:peptide/nickel transport system permease protein